MATSSTAALTRSDMIDPRHPADIIIFLKAVLSHARQAHVDPRPQPPAPAPWQQALSKLYRPPSPDPSVPLRVFEAGIRTANYSSLYESSAVDNHAQPTPYVVLARDLWEGHFLIFLCTLLRRRVTLTRIAQEIIATMGPGHHSLEETIRIMFNGRQRLEVTLAAEAPNLEDYDIYTYPRVAKEYETYLSQLSEV